MKPVNFRSDQIAIGSGDDKMSDTIFIGLVDILYLLIRMIEPGGITLNCESVITVIPDSLSDTTVNGCGEVRSIGRFKVDQGNIIFFVQCQISGIVIRNVVIFFKGSQYGFPGFFRYGSFIIYNFVNGCSGNINFL